MVLSKTVTGGGVGGKLVGGTGVVWGLRVGTGGFLVGMNGLRVGTDALRGGGVTRALVVPGVVLAVGVGLGMMGMFLLGVTGGRTVVAAVLF